MASLIYAAGTLGYDKFKSHRSKRRASKNTFTNATPHVDEKESTSHPDPSPPQSPTSSSAPPEYTSAPTSSNSSPTSVTSSDPPPFRASSDSSNSGHAYRRSDGRLDSIGEEMMSSVEGRPRRTSSVYSRESVSDIRRRVRMAQEQERYPEDAPPEYETVVHGHSRKGGRGRRLSEWWSVGRWGRQAEFEEGGLRRVGEVDFDMRL